MQSVGLFLPVRQSQGISQFNCKLAKSHCPREGSDIYFLLMQPRLSETLARTKITFSINTIEDKLQQKLLNM